jgi:cytochrome c553
MLSRLNLGGFGVVTGIFTIYLLLCGLGLRAKFVIYYVTVMLTLLILYLVFLGKLMFRILIGLIVTLSTACALADGNPQRGKELSAVCAACHGQDGNSPAGAFPSLAGQGQRYLVKQLNEIKSGQRAAVLMTGILDTYSAQDMLDVASFYSAQTPKGGGVDPELLVLGETIYRAGIARKSVAACTACHSPTGQGNAAAAFPMLAGQWPEYTEGQLKAFRSGTRNNDGDSRMMRISAMDLSDNEIAAVASYIHGLKQ